MSLKDALVWLPLILVIVSITAAWQYQKDQLAAQREHLRVLEHIIVSEFPAYTAAIDWSE